MNEEQSVLSLQELQEPLWVLMLPRLTGPAIAAYRGCSKITRDFIDGAAVSCLKPAMEPLLAAAFLQQAASSADIQKALQEQAELNLALRLGLQTAVKQVPMLEGEWLQKLSGMRPGNVNGWP